MENSDMNERPVVKKPEYVDLTKAFPNEARDLTPWLADNIDAIADRLGLVLSIEQREKPVGDFKLDLLCKDGDGNKVIIENQVYATDHDHLGKLLTYLVNLDAKTAIWVTSEPRPEHQKVVEWLNESMPGDMAFYLVKAEALRITDTTYSPVFTLLAGPDKQSRTVGEEKKEWAKKEARLYDFWKALIQHRAAKDTPFAGRNPTKRNSLRIDGDFDESSFGFAVVRKGSYAYSSFALGDQKKEQALYNSLVSQRKAIEAEYGAELIWQPRSGGNWPWVGVVFLGRGLDKADDWSALHAEMIDAFKRLDKTVRPRLLRAYQALK